MDAGSSFLIIKAVKKASVWQNHELPKKFLKLRLLLVCELCWTDAIS